jgi:hypothetical protein
MNIGSHLYTKHWGKQFCFDSIRKKKLVGLQLKKNKNVSNGLKKKFRSISMLYLAFENVNKQVRILIKQVQIFTI